MGFMDVHSMLQCSYLQALNHIPKEQHQEGSQLDKDFLLAP